MLPARTPKLRQQALPGQKVPTRDCSFLMLLFSGHPSRSLDALKLPPCNELGSNAYAMCVKSLSDMEIPNVRSRRLGGTVCDSDIDQRDERRLCDACVCGAWCSVQAPAEQRTPTNATRNNDPRDRANSEKLRPLEHAHFAQPCDD